MHIDTYEHYDLGALTRSRIATYSAANQTQHQEPRYYEALQFGTFAHATTAAIRKVKERRQHSQKNKDKERLAKYELGSAEYYNSKEMDDYADFAYSFTISNDAIQDIKAWDNAKLILGNNDLNEDDLILSNLSKVQIQEKAQKEFNSTRHVYLTAEKTGKENIAEAREALKKIRIKLTRRQRYARAAIQLKTLGGRYGEHYCSNFALEKRREANAANNKFLEKSVIVSDRTGKSIPLKEVAFTKKKRLSEMYTLAKGLEKLAELQGLSWMGVVVTLESSAHANPAWSDGDSGWSGELPKASAKRLQHGWAKVRANLAKIDITLAGFWTREAHMDGTPHVNFIVYFDGGNAQAVKDAFNKQFWHSNKAGAVKFENNPSIKFMADSGKKTYIDKNGDVQKSASFASYAMKYFMKSFAADDSDDRSLSEEAWASDFGLRRYGLFGIPKMGVWRRLRASEVTPKDPAIAAMWRVARRGDAAEFIQLNGGIGIKDKDRQFQTASRLSATGKSKIIVGVRNTANGKEFINKKIGEWSIVTLKVAVATIKVQSIQQVTVKPNYPRVSQNQHYLPAETQKAEELRLYNYNKWREDLTFEAQDRKEANFMAAIKAQGHGRASSQPTWCH